MILAGDIGGTKTVLALFERAPGNDGNDLRAVRETRFASADYAGLDDIVRVFLAAGIEQPTAASFGVAGPVDGVRARITNLPWMIDAAGLASAFGFAEVVLLNDLQAAAYGALHLPPESLAVLQPGANTNHTTGGTIAVIAPGTGLGEAILYWDGARHRALPSEGGHSDFAPQSDREMRLLAFLRDRFGGHVSWERVLSGAGLGNLYDFLRDVEHLAAPPLAAGDRNAAISAAGLAGTSPCAAEALAMFATLLGAEAGNLALKCFATGGIVITGGIPAKILPALSSPADAAGAAAAAPDDAAPDTGDSNFLRALRAKGRFGDWLATLPVKVALDPRAPLLGAAYALAR